MILYWLIQIILMMIVSVSFWTQMIKPALEGRPLFPFFRRRTHLEQRLVDAYGQLDEVDLESQVLEVEQRVQQGCESLTNSEEE